jgi:Glucose / Sorbosone dehydrogenase
MGAVVLAALLLLALPAGAAAAPQLVPVGNFAGPVHVTAPPGDAARLVVVEKDGRVQLLVDGRRAVTPFLDVVDITANEGERGLLSIAFHPDYAANGLFYYFVTGNAAAGGDVGDLTVFEGRRLDADRADPDYRRLVLRISHSAFSNHNGGQLAFGPDGLLYVSTGDGGGNQSANAQNESSLLGKMLRLDPRSASGPQIWARGLRNPWRFSFDRVTGDMVIGDVGGGLREEINFAPAGTGPGRNYGWDVCEGDQPTPCPVANAAAPALSLPRGNDDFTGVIGGVVVRDPGLPTLSGRYAFGDLSQPQVLSVAMGTQASDLRSEISLPISAPSSFGEDACGHVYVASIHGPVSRIQDGALSPCPLPQQPGGPVPGGGGGPAAQARVPDRLAPVLRLRYRGTQRLRRLRLVLQANEDCAAILGAKRFRTRRVSLRAGARRVVRIKPTRRGARRLRRAIARRGRARVTIRIAARDAAGNTALRRVRLGVVRRP